MSKLFFTDESFITERRFATLRDLGEGAPQLKQPEPSDGGSSKTPQSARSTRQDTAGCFLTRAVDLTNERNHWISVVRDPREVERLRIESKLRQLGIHYDLNFNLNSVENMSVLRLPLHRHHDLYSTIVFTPCLDTLESLRAWLEADNKSRQDAISKGFYDTGRSLARAVNERILDKSAFKYELVILHPTHFMLHNEELLIKTGDSEWKGYSHRGGNFLVDKDNNRLLPFNNDATGDLNPFMVHFAAALRFRRFCRFEPERVTALDKRSQCIIRLTEEVHHLILWNSKGPTPPASVTQERKVSNIHNSAPLLPTSASTKITAESDAHSPIDPLDSDDIEVRMDAMDQLLLGVHEFLPLPDLGEGGDSR